MDWRQDEKERKNKGKGERLQSPDKLLGEGVGFGE